MNASTLRAIADALDKLAEVPGRVSAITVNGLTVDVKFNDSQRDGTYYEVVSIEGVVRS